MSRLRLLLLSEKEKVSGLIPSYGVLPVLYAVSTDPSDLTNFWNNVKVADKSLEKLFTAAIDPSPTMKPNSEGLLVVNFAEKIISSFQRYLPIRRAGTLSHHNGLFSEQELPDSQPLFYKLPTSWQIKNYPFGEK